MRGTPGPITDTEGIVLGEHPGLAFYTLGQRQGIGLGGMRDRDERPWYVAGKDSPNNTLTVTQDERDLAVSCLDASNLNWISPTMRDLGGNARSGNRAIRCTAKVRYRQPDQPCAVTIDGDNAHVVFDQPQRAVTPGQFVAFYDDAECLGGGRIDAAGAPSQHVTQV